MIKMGAIKAELAFYRALANDRRTPRVAKWFLLAAVAYVLMPFDIIPDFIPVLGHLDDMVIVPLLLWSGLRLIPGELKDEIRGRVGDKGHLDLKQSVER